ncbi:MAG TPA: hypothetical protein VMM15_23225 [Bradyrhizobium sp.]|nr:hypothetical protein [Bradyrhizobium sp.]
MRNVKVGRFGLSFLALGMLVVPLLQATPALSATAYVSITGSGATCTPAAPCATLDAAVAVSGAAGKIIILSAGDYQGLTNPITGGMTITTQVSGVAVRQDTLTQPVFTINAGANDTVTLHGFSIVGGAHGTNGIQVDNAGRVYVENCGVKNVPGLAMFLQPNPGANQQSQLYISNTEVSNATTGLILIAPRSGFVKTYFNRAEVHNSSGYGIKSDGSNGQIDNAITDSAFFSITGAAIHGFTPAAGSPGAPVVRIAIERTTVLNSGGGGSVANGGGSRVFVNKSTLMSNQFGARSLNGGSTVLTDSVVTGNGTGVDLNNTSPVFSFGNNSIQFNGFSQCGNDVCNGAGAGTMGTSTLR